MGKIVVVNNVTLDGVTQGLGRPDEDTRGGFEHGGWGIPYADQVQGEAMGKSMAQTRGILLGRRTYEDFYGYWPKQTDNPYTEVLNQTPKYVASDHRHRAAAVAELHAAVWRLGCQGHRAARPHRRRDRGARQWRAGALVGRAGPGRRVPDAHSPAGARQRDPVVRREGHRGVSSGSPTRLSPPPAW